MICYAAIYLTRMRILHLLAPAPFGGLERVVQSLSIEQATTSHEVHVAAILDPGNTGDPLMETLASRGVHTHRVQVGTRRYRLERALVRNLCATLRPDIVHTHGYRTDVLHGPTARSAGIPAVATVHGFTGGNWKNRLYEHLQRRAYRRADAVVAVSKPLRENLIARGVPPERVHCVPNAWADPIPFLDRDEALRVLNLPASAWRVGFIGRLSHEKGPDIFLEAFARLAGESANRVEAILLGDGPMRSSLVARAGILGVSESTRFLGAIDSAGRLIRALDVLVLSSRTEGTPMVLLEAMAAGVPIVATPVGGVPDVVSEREAVLVPSGDPEALASAILGVQSDRVGAFERSKRAVDRLGTEFNAVRWRERYDAVYAGCLGN